MQPNPKPSKLNWLEFVLLLAPFLFLAAEWGKFPARIPIHWNIHGKIDGWASKPFGLLMLPLTSLFMYVLITFVPHLDPKIRRSHGEYDRTLGIVRIIRVTMVAFFAGIFALQAATALGFAVPMNRCVFNGCLLLFLVIGNYLTGLRPNYFAGIRTPWTLENPETWRATHRLGGRIMFFGALLLVGMQLFIKTSILLLLFMVFVLGFTIWAFVYSWNHSRTHAQVR